MEQLNTGDAFPALEAESVKQGRVALPAALPADHYGVVLGYRAHW